MKVLINLYNVQLPTCFLHMPRSLIPQSVRKVMFCTGVNMGTLYVRWKRADGGTGLHVPPGWLHQGLSWDDLTDCVTRAPLLYIISSWVALSFKVCQWVSESVRHQWHLSRSPLCSIYKGTNALYWLSIINYWLLPPHSVLYWPSTQLHHLVNSQLSQLDLVAVIV